MAALCSPIDLEMEETYSWMASKNRKESWYGSRGIKA